MTHRPFREVEDWLRAEAEGREADADALFAAVFATGLPRLEPSPGLPDRILAALGRAALPAARPLPRWAQAATLALLALGGLAAAAFWSTWVFDLLHTLWTYGPRALRIGATLSAGLLSVLAKSAWNAASIARALALVLGSGPGAAILAGNLLLAVAASVAMKRILSLEEKSS